TTNSITQGEQVAMLWPLVFAEANAIQFAHTSFLWSNLASNKAVVSCVILGLSVSPSGSKRLFADGVVRTVPNISPYLVPAETVIVKKRTSVISDVGRMQSGNKPTDGGYLTMSTEEKDALLAISPEAARFIKRYVGSRELINGGGRWCIWVDDANLGEAMEIEALRVRFDKVRQVRLSSGGAQANENAATPHRFVFAPHSYHPA